MTVEYSTIHLECSPECESVMAYHRDFPEIRVQGNSNLEAITLLGHQLTRALDSALTDWRREGLLAALAETQACRENYKPH